MDRARFEAIVGAADPAVTAAEEAAAAASITCPATVKQLKAGKLKANGVRMGMSRYGWPYAKATIADTTFFTVFNNVVEAACAADLAQLVVHGPRIKHIS